MLCVWWLASSPIFRGITSPAIPETGKPGISKIGPPSLDQTCPFYLLKYAAAYAAVEADEGTHPTNFCGDVNIAASYGKDSGALNLS